MNGRDAILAVAYKNKEDWDAILKDIKNHVYPSEEDVAKAREYFAKKYPNKAIVTIIDTCYPEKYKSMYKPPFVVAVGKD
jgi:predicted Rossmann fold nucleotide-binding protein DprA/Smf involved in DNA uptake